jgi:hypothetical protein
MKVTFTATKWVSILRALYVQLQDLMTVYDHTIYPEVPLLCPAYAAP